jgi:CRISPR-associated endonuclease Csn1
MKKTIIGGDLGTAKTGITLISIVDDETKIVDSKVLIDNFKNGHEYNTNNYKTPATIRREYRSSRVNRRHKRMKIVKLSNFLCEKFNLDEIKKTSNVLDLKIFGLNDKLSLNEISFVLLNYARYNGYNTLDDESSIDDEAKSKYKKKLSESKLWCDNHPELTISSYYKEINNNSIKYRCSDYPIVKELHLHELKLFLAKQKEFHSEITDDFNEEVIKMIYYRRDLKSSRHLISDCEYEYNRKVCPKYTLLSQEYIIWQGIHNLRLNDESIENTEKLILFKKLNENSSLKRNEILDIILEYRRDNYKLLHSVTSYDDIECAELTDITNDNVFTFTSKECEIIKRLIRNGVNSNDLLNKLYLNDNYKISHKELTGNRTRTKIREIIGNKLDLINNELIENDIIEKIGHMIYSESYSTRRKKSLIKFNSSQNIINLSNNEIESLSIAKLPDGFSDCSNKALKKIISHMNGQNDYLDHYSAIMKVYGNTIKSVKKKLTLDKIKEGSLRNPIVEHKTNQFIKIMNGYIKQGLIDNHTSVHIEFSRDLMLPKKIRLSIEKNNDNNKKFNKELENLLLFHDYPANSKNVKRVKLWIEQGGKYETNGKNFSITNDACDLYTNTPITLINALDGNSYNTDHIVPKSRCFNNTLNNFILTSRKSNELKDARTSYEFVEETFSDDEKKTFYDNLKKYYGNNKRKLESFSYGYDNMPENMGENQLVLNSFIAKKTKSQLETYFDKVICVNGITTDYVKNVLGYTKMFKTNIKDNMSDYKKKEINDDEIDKRYDDRNHALDSIVIAMIDDKITHRINNLNQYYSDDKNVSLDNFIKNHAVSFFNSENHLNMVSDSLNKTITIRRKDKHPIFNKTIYYNNEKHKISCVRGQLHDETFYSSTNIDGINVLTKQKSLLNIEKDLINALKKKTSDDIKMKINDIINTIVNEKSRDLLRTFIYENDLTPETIKSALKKFVNDPLRKNAKSLLVKAYYHNSVQVGKNLSNDKNHVRNVIPNNNYLLIIYKKNNKHNHICFSLLDYTKGKHKDFLKNNQIVHVFKKNDYFVCDYDNNQLKTLINNNDYSFLSKLYFIPEMNNSSFFYEPYFSNNKDCFRIRESSNTFFSKNKIITKIKINDFGKIFV